MFKPRKTYKSCADLPLYNFIKMVVYNDVDQLYSEKKTLFNRNIDLSGIYSDIYSEYTDLSDNPQSRHIFDLAKDVTFLNNKLIIIFAAVNVLVQSYDPDLCAMLRRMGFYFDFTPESMPKDLKTVLTMTKAITMNRDQALSEYNSLQENGVPLTEDSYYTMVREIARFNGFHIDTKKTTVLEFLKDRKAFERANTPKNTMV